MVQVEEGRFSTEGSVHLDALRGSAAFVVVLGHTRSLYFRSTAAYQYEAAPLSVRKDEPTAVEVSGALLPIAEARITIGNEAVMIFFVLSGFLVGGSVLRAVHKNAFSWRDYLLKRLTRLWIVLVPALLLGLVLDHAGAAISGMQSIYGSPAGQLIVVGDVLERLRPLVLLGNVFFTQGILVPDFGVNESLWSLAFEFWYYLLFPMLVIAILSNAKLLSRVAAVGGFVMISYFVGTWILQHFAVWILGALVAWLPMKLSERTARVFAAATAVVLVLALPLMRKVPVSIYKAEWVFAILSGCLIYAVKHLGRKRRPDFYSALSGFFSRISYTLYLVHLPIAVFVCALLNRPWHLWEKTGVNVAIWLITNIAVIAMAYLFYRVFEANTESVRSRVSEVLFAGNVHV